VGRGGAVVAEGRCRSLATARPPPTSPATRHDPRGFTPKAMPKDRRRALATGRARGGVSPFGPFAGQIYQPLRNRGLGKRDFSVIIKMLEGMHDGARRAAAIAPIVSMYRRNGPVMS
jgi:3-hydroxyisobutyrate dehydrogenase-like beta-hydroxyacid dehydrogenase